MTPDTNGVAIIGMAGRFPKARNIDEYWRNLCNGVDGISFFSDEELEREGAAFARDDARYVKARGILEAAETFDAAFFGINPREAEIMDPQHRLFLECASEALENSGYRPDNFRGAIGVFGGMSMNTYLANNLRGQPDLLAQVGEYQVMLANDKDFLTTRVSYKLNLRGPSLNIQTACSTSLVAICVACQNLLNYECDIALAGAVSVMFPQKRGYLYQQGGIVSPDGHCRAFDAKAAGTVAGEGVGLVVLKRLEEAIRDGDFIYAAIKGFAINNDGSLKVGYAAPSIEGQAEAIQTAQMMAGFAPETISYVEAHGTGTPLGDPIEVQGLTNAFRNRTDRKAFCAIGSVKSNIGHLDAAAGVAGLIKTALALRHGMLPPTLHFEAPNPKIDFENSPFYINAKLNEWKTEKTPRRAGVSSFGIGGTNAHVVLEETPRSVAAVENPGNERRTCLLTLSAKTEAALEQAKHNLAAHLQAHPEMNLADVAFTLHVGRREFQCRWAGACDSAEEAIKLLTEPTGKNANRTVTHENARVVFMFPGQGAQHINMCRELYEQGGLFRQTVDECCDLLKAPLGMDLRDVLYPGAEAQEKASQRLTQTAITQPALFVIEYSLAMLWMSWGIRPQAMIGHSIGEYVAACLAGVFSLADALKLVTARGRMMQELPPGTMLAVRFPEAEIMDLLESDLSLAAVNAPGLCVVSGNEQAVGNLEKQLASRSIACTRLHTSHAFHSAMVDPILESFADLVNKTPRHAPQIPYLSNVSGTWITESQATDPEYWARHLRQTVRCSGGLAELIRDESRLYLEVGPGQTMTSLVRQHPGTRAEVIPSQKRANQPRSDLASLLKAAGLLWLCGAGLDWEKFHTNENRRRLPLPAYPFERIRFWIEPVRTSGNAQMKPALESASRPSPADPMESNRASQPGEASEKQFPTEGHRSGIAGDIRAIFEQLSGRDLAGASDKTTFIEMGFDSLFLTQASIAMEKKLNARVAFRDLLDSLSTFGALASHLGSIVRSSRKPGSEPATIRASAGPETAPIKSQSRQSRAEELLKRLDQLSDSEVEALLSEDDSKEVLS